VPAAAAVFQHQAAAGERLAAPVAVPVAAGTDKVMHRCAVMAQCMQICWECGGCKQLEKGPNGLASRQ